MNKETLEFVRTLDRNIHLCEQASSYEISGIYDKVFNPLSERYEDGLKRPLPKEVCAEIHDVIVKWKEDYQLQLDEL